jgi:hypothetical protein
VKDEMWDSHLVSRLPLVPSIKNGTAPKLFQFLPFEIGHTQQNQHALKGVCFMPLHSDSLILSLHNLN